MVKIILILLLFNTNVRGENTKGKRQTCSEPPAYMNTSLDFEIPAEDLVERMTLEEKVSQLGMPLMRYHGLGFGSTIGGMSARMVLLVRVPIKQLRGFERVQLKKGKGKVVTFELNAPEDLRYYDARLRRYVAEPGEFEIQIGASSENIKLTDSILVR